MASTHAAAAAIEAELTAGKHQIYYIDVDYKAESEPLPELEDKPAEDAEKKDDTESAKSQTVFSTEVDEKVLEDAVRRRESAVAQKQREQQVNTVKPIRMAAPVMEAAKKHYETGVDLMHTCQFEKAINRFSKAIKLDDQVAQPFELRALAHVYLCDFQSATLNIRHPSVSGPSPLSLSPRIAYFLCCRGQCLFDLGRHVEALECFTKASELMPNSHVLPAHCIKCLVTMNKYKEALAMISDQLLLLQDEDCAPSLKADFLMMKARIHTALHQQSLCFFTIEEALQIDSEHRAALATCKAIKDQAEALKDEAVYFNLDRRFNMALARITAAIEMNPNKPSYYMLRGCLNRKVDRFSEAVDDYLLSIEKSEHDPTVQQQVLQYLSLTYNELAMKCIRQEKWDEALKLLNEAIRRQNAPGEFYLNRAECLNGLGDQRGAMQDFEVAIEIITQSDKSADENVKQRSAKKITNIYRRMARIHYEQGLVQFNENQLQESMVELNAAIELDATVADYYSSRARLKFMLDDVDGAQDDALKCLSLEPQHRDVKKFLQRLFPMGLPRAVQQVQEQTSTNRTQRRGGKPNGPDPVRHLLLEKQQLQREIHDRFRNRDSLCDTRPKILPLGKSPEEEQADEEPSPTGWRNFTLGVGTL